VCALLLGITGEPNQSQPRPCRLPGSSCDREVEKGCVKAPGISTKTGRSARPNLAHGVGSPRIIVRPKTTNVTDSKFSALSFRHSIARPTVFALLRTFYTLIYQRLRPLRPRPKP
jgi:hypothetical protein